MYQGGSAGGQPTHHRAATNPGDAAENTTEGAAGVEGGATEDSYDLEIGSVKI